MKRFQSLVRVTLAIVTLAHVGSAQRASKAATQTAIDSVVASFLKDGRAAGMSVGVVRGNDTLVLKGYGKADLELDVPTPPRAVYEIGSVTKQFTASGILLLADEGKLSLDDDLTKYLPDYPTAGNKIPIRRLLDHTSGIKGYTELPKFGTIMTRKLPKDSLVALFKDVPFDFPTGTGMVYNNSAYFLAGMIIEKVAGMPYSDFVAKRFFEPLGMKDSHYCNERKIVKNRAHGYDMGPGGQLMLKGYLDHTYPYAAGSLCSTAWDLVTWLQALHSGRVLSEKAYRELITPDTLNDGTRLRYAKGVARSTVAGHPAIEHGGGINGFVTASAWFPEEKMAVAVLINTAGPVSADSVAASLVDVVLGRRSDMPAATKASDLTPYIGVYQGAGRGAQLNLTFSSDSGVLSVRQQPGPPAPQKLTFLGNDTFGRGRERYYFTRSGSMIVSVRVDRVYQNTVLTRRP
ncbi:MAG TPA: serine hydrolase domain-containing protein [Gemmatimonadaceae bacterium]|nr:serine hydrolase domain-containing protein [Gemmatimonadaceae bacterium]